MTKKILIGLLVVVLLAALFPVASYIYWLGRAYLDPMGALRIQEQFEKLPSEELLRKLHSIDPISPYPSIAIDVLTKRKEPMAVPVFIELTKSRNKMLRSHVIRSLCEIGDKRAIPRLLEIVEAGEIKPPSDSHDALYSLCLLGYEPVRPYVLKMLRSPDALNNGSLTMLRNIGKKEDIPTLGEMLNKVSPNDINARSHKGDIRAAIKAIEERDGK